MTKPKNSPKTGSASTVAPIRPTQQVAIQPPDGWQLHGPFGFMRAKPASGEVVQLARLAEVMRWVMTTRELPRKAALDVLCDNMPADVMDWLYELQPSDYAKPVSGAAQFGYQTASQIEAGKAKQMQETLQREFERSRGDLYRSVVAIRSGVAMSKPVPSEPGRPSLMRKIKESWPLEKWNKAAVCDKLDEPRSMLTRLAVPLAKAHEIGGYGRTDAAPVSDDTGEASSESNEWTAERLWVACQRFERDGKGRHMKRLVELSGIKDREIRRLIEPYRKPTIMGSMASMLTSKSTGSSGKRRG